MKFKLIISCFGLGFSPFMLAQKAPLNPEVYDGWQQVQDSQLTNDGKFSGYIIAPQEGDDVLFVRELKSEKSISFPRGTDLLFTSSSKFGILRIKPFYKDLKAVKDKKLKRDKLTNDSLAIINLRTQEITKFPNLKSFKTPKKGGSWLAYLTSTEKEKEDDKDKDQDTKVTSGTLTLVNLDTGKKMIYKDVLDYSFDEQGNSLAFITQKPDEKKKKDSEEKKVNKSAPRPYNEQTVNWVDLKTGNLRQLQKANAGFSKLSFDRAGSQLAYIGTKSAKNDLVKDYQLFYSGKENAIIDNQNPKLPKTWGISENYTPTFSRDGKQLYFGIAPRPIPKDTALIANDHAILDVWNYKDDYLQPQQLKNLKRDLAKSYLAVLQTNHPSTFQPLADENVDETTLINRGDANYVLGMTDKDSRIAEQWRGSDRKTYFIINNQSGQRKEILKDLYGRAFPSPLGNHIVYFNQEDGNWYDYDVKTGAIKELNKGLKVQFTNELNDVPEKPGAYGIAAWTDNDESVIIRDRYDLWEFFLNGKTPARNLTHGYGRTNEITFNTYQFDPDKRSFNRKAAIYLSGSNNKTKAEGIFKTEIVSQRAPKQVFMDNIWGMRTVKKALNVDQYLFTKETFVKSPDLYTTTNFVKQQQLTHINPQQTQYNWGNAELIHWTTPKGHQSDGVLYKPEDFDSNKKYPMVVYFYERLSDNLNRYQQPAPTPSRLNITYFVSNGYLVFTPDIAYTDGHPGESAAEYINSGVDYLKQNPWVDGQHIGIQGQSWGGYQVAYLITATNRYAAAWSGAPVANMTSAYGGIRWASGMNRQFQYEQTQSRIGKTLWEPGGLDLYLENSPLFHLDKTATPVVIMSNDNDGAVPWYQGIEMFTALRRLGKKVWLLDYNGEEHNLVKRQNRKDISIREQQFFDHYLKGKPAPVWMTKGIPATMKGKTWGFETSD